MGQVPLGVASAFGAAVRCRGTGLFSRWGSRDWMYDLQGLEGHWVCAKGRRRGSSCLCPLRGLVGSQVVPWSPAVSSVLRGLHAYLNGDTSQ